MPADALGPSATSSGWCGAFPDSSVGKESACNAGDPGLVSGSERSAGEGIGYLFQYSWASLVAQLVKNLRAMWETWVRSLGLEESPEEGKGYPLQYPGLENSKDCIAHGIAKTWTQLSDFHFTFRVMGHRRGWREAIRNPQGLRYNPYLVWAITDSFKAKELNSETVVEENKNKQIHKKKKTKKNRKPGHIVN